MTISKKEINTIQNFFRNKPVLKAYLFGSFARNEAGADSDIDILVDLDYSSHIGLGFITMQLELQNLLHRPDDLVSSQALSEFIAPFIDHDKQLIYER